jgi:beta-lactam-binding protein with PASTA domain
MKQAREPKAPKVRKPAVPLKERYARIEASSRALARKVLPRPADDERTKLFKTFAWSLIGMVFLVVFLSVSVFFLALRGAEETMVPQVVGKDLATALVELQEKELSPYVQVKFSDDPRDKGNIVSQDPEGGILAKAGRRVTLWVSKGAIVDNVASFVGQNVADVQLRLKTLFANQANPLLYLTSQPVYVFNSSPEGTVLEQKPAAGTPLSSPTELVVVVSKGPKGQTVKVGKYDDKPWTEALAQLIAENKPFVVKVKKAERGEGPGLVVGQAPAAGGEMPRGTPVTLTVAQPVQPTDGRVFQVVETTLPEYPILVDVKVEVQKTTGDRTTLYQLKHPGGLLTVPLVATPGDVVVVSVLDKEVFTKKVGE